jgi:6,7-dimethyl-8-ribityllumazine synthase
MPKRHFDFSKVTISSPETLRFGIIVAQGNSEITSSLFESAYQFLIKQGILKDHITVIDVPGSFELTSGADILLTKNNELDGVICLGCVIQGETRHFEFICNAVANGLTQVSIKYNKPVIFGVLTTDTFEQAKDRAGGKLGNKGEEAAASALQMALLRHI